MRPRKALIAAGLAVIAAAGPAFMSPSAARALPSVNPGCIGGGGFAPAGCALTGPSGGIISGGAGALTTAALGAVATSVLGSAKYVLNATAQVLTKTTTPQLTSTWFSATYWRVAGLAAVLTLPFLFAAAVQSLIRSDLSLLMRAAFGYLPVALLAVGIAAPLSMLLLAASDQMSATVSSAAGNQGVSFLDHATGLLGGLAAGFESPFVLFLVGLLTVGVALALWVELLVREAAVYVIVLMLPLVFAAFVWPARRVWAIRAVELLVALILSKFVIVAVLSLGGAALDQSANRSVTGLLAGGVLLALASFAPWAVLRLIPLAEVASAAAGSLKTGSATALLRLQQGDAWAGEADRWHTKMAQMRKAAREAAAPSTPAPDLSPATPDVSPAPATPAPDQVQPDQVQPDQAPAGHPTTPATPPPSPKPETTAPPPPAGAPEPQRPLDLTDPGPPRDFFSSATAPPQDVPPQDIPPRDVPRQDDPPLPPLADNP